MKAASLNGTVASVLTGHAAGVAQSNMVLAPLGDNQFGHRRRHDASRVLGPGMIQRGYSRISAAVIGCSS
jgi:hypothetical protein